MSFAEAFNAKMNKREKERDFNIFLVYIHNASFHFWLQKKPVISDWLSNIFLNRAINLI